MVAVKKSKPCKEPQRQPHFPGYQVGALGSSSLTMMAQFNEKQKKSAA